MKLLYLIFILFFLACNHLTPKGTKAALCFANNFSQHIEQISLGDTGKIKNLNGRFIQIEGYLNYEFENVALYPYKEKEFTKALWLNFSDSISKSRAELKAMNYKEVIVVGKINVLHKGHYNWYMAELDSVFCIRLK